MLNKTLYVGNVVSSIHDRREVGYVNENQQTLFIWNGKMSPDDSMLKNTQFLIIHEIDYRLIIQGDSLKVEASIIFLKIEHKNAL